MIHRAAAGRKLADHLLKVISACAALVGILVLAWILAVVLQRGAAAISWDFFFHRTLPTGEAGGGVGNAILGSAVLVGLAVVIGVPLGLMVGVYLSEFGRDTRLGTAVRFSANVMMGIPSIIVGLFVYELMVVPMHSFSGWAGAVALAILMLPVVARTSEDMLQLVPNSLRESALALGAPRWKVTFHIVFRAAKVGLLTGVLLAIARISGETAPLLFTCLNSPYWPTTLNGYVANLPVTIFIDAMQPYDDLVRLAWGASLLITVGVLALNISTRMILRRSGHE
jgi:phosphate transport system permease protein